MQIIIGGAVQIAPRVELLRLPPTNFRLPNHAQAMASAIEMPAAEKLNASYLPGSINRALKAIHRHRRVRPRYNQRMRSVADRNRGRACVLSIFGPLRSFGMATLDGQEEKLERIVPAPRVAVVSTVLGRVGNLVVAMLTREVVEQSLRGDLSPFVQLQLSEDIGAG